MKLTNNIVVEKVISLKSDEMMYILGVHDENLKIINKEYSVQLVNRDGKLKIRGNEKSVSASSSLINDLFLKFDKSNPLSKEELSTIIMFRKINKSNNIMKNNEIYYGKKGPIYPRTSGQKTYYDTITSNDISFGIGPAGTGKTFLAVAFGVAAIKKNKVERIILSRPAVEAGENLGFLPGDMQEKVDPYLAPLYEALHIILPDNNLKKLLENKIIEIIPLAYMRGRTLDNAFLIFDEAQNSTIKQMKMFLTRLGKNSQAVITGDITQIDLKNKNESGLLEAANILKNIEGIGFTYFNDSDIVRHPLVAKILKAYERKKNGI